MSPTVQMSVIARRPVGPTWQSSTNSEVNSGLLRGARNDGPVVQNGIKRQRLITKRATYFIRRIFSFLGIIFLGGALAGCGEKYSEQGHTLVTAMHRELISQGLCKTDFYDFLEKVPLHGGHGNKVNFSIYKPDRKTLAALFEFVVTHGIEITKGVPISISVYPKSREEYGNIIFSPKSTIELEIKEGIQQYKSANLLKETDAMTPEERINYAQTMFARHPEIFPEERRQSILNSIVTLGMTPFEAKLAGGAFAFKVVADKARWPEHSDPLKVMWAQSMQADNSEIWMTFRNKTQFAEQAECFFRVYFERGHAIKIERQEG